MKRITLIAGGAVVGAIALAGGGVAVASAFSGPISAQVMPLPGIDTSSTSPTPFPTRIDDNPSSDDLAGGAPTAAPSATASPSATPSPSAAHDIGDDHGHDGVVTVPPAAPTVIDRHGDPNAPDDHPSADDLSGVDDHGGRSSSGSGSNSGSGSGSGSSGSGSNSGSGSSGSGSSGSGRSGADDGPGHH